MRQNSPKSTGSSPRKSAAPKPKAEGGKRRPAASAATRRPERWTQAGRPIAIGVGGLAQDELLLRRFEWREELGQPFEGRVFLRSENHSIDPLKVLGQPVAIRVDAPGGGVRYFTGFVSQFEQTEAMGGGLAGYEAVVVPWSWFMTRTADCRIFQEQDVVAIVSKVMKEAPAPTFVNRLVRKYPAYEYKVQYRETDFAFVQRLLEFEGIFYYFSHTAEGHTLNLVDSNSARSGGTDRPAALRYLPGSESKSDPEAVFEWRLVNRVQAGRYQATDYDFKKPSTSLFSKSEIPRPHAQGQLDIFDYPGRYFEHAAGDTLVRTRMEELASQYVRTTGRTSHRGVYAGGLVGLTGHPRADQNREYLVVKALHTADAGEFDADPEDSEQSVYECAFESMPVDIVYRPPQVAPIPQIRGPQTAMVVGPSGQEIYTDEYGRVKLQFHWDRYGKSDEHSSCWVRVSQPWAGKGWGGMQIPRIGQEIVVEFLEADPDRPIITGRVYNAESMPPVSAAGRDAKKGEVNPKNAVEAAMQMTMRSNSLGGSGGHNEITMHDAGGAEKLFIKAQKDEVHLVQNDRKDTVGHDEHRDVSNDRTRSVGNNESINIGANQNITVGDNLHIKAGSTITIEVGLSKITMNKAGVISVTGTMITIAGMANVNVAAPLTNIAGAVMLNLGAPMIMAQGMAVRVGASESFILKAGEIESRSDSEHRIQGKKIKLN